jgi:hypothetical protein
MPRARLSRVTGRYREIYWVAIPVLLVFIVVPVALAWPAVLLVFPAAGVLYLLKHPWVRLAWFVGGALLVFQVGEGLTPPKLAYIAGVAVCVVISAVRMRTLLRTSWGRRFKPAVIGASILLAWMLFVTPIQSVVIQGIDPVLWARDALTYILAAAAVFIGIDAASNTSVRLARGITVAVGLLAAAGFSFVWIQGRGYSGSEDIDRAFLASLIAVVLPIALCFALGLAGKRLRIWWVALGLFMIVAVLITGTRTGVVLGVTLLGMIGSARMQRISLPKVLMGAAAGVAAFLIVVPFAAGLFSSADDVQARLQSITRALAGEFGRDPSGSMRVRATQIGLDIFADHPLFGHGVGRPFPNLLGDATAAGFSLDTPAMYLAKFGFIGLAVVIPAFILIVAPALRHERGRPWLLESTAGWGAVFAWVALLPLASTTEDKGFALSLAMLMMLVGAAARASHDEPADSLGGEFGPSIGEGASASGRRDYLRSLGLSGR